MIDRRMAQMRAEGVEFHTHCHIGVDKPIDELCDELRRRRARRRQREARDLDVPGRSFNGIHFAMDFLRPTPSACRASTSPTKTSSAPRASTSSSSAAATPARTASAPPTATVRQSVTQIEILDKPPEKEDKGLTWPNWPNKLRTSSSQEEGCERHWNVLTKSFEADEHGNVKALNYVLVRWDKDENGRWQMSEVEGSEAQFKADLVLLAMGFLHPVHEGMLDALKQAKGLELDPRGNVKGTTDGPGAYQTNIPGVFAAGDMRRGQSLVVWAIREGQRRSCPNRSRPRRCSGRG
jgi:glutamate synthase (NADPH/NADH) small chain